MCTSVVWPREMQCISGAAVPVTSRGLAETDSFQYTSAVLLFEGMCNKLDQAGCIDLMKTGVQMEQIYMIIGACARLCPTSVRLIHNELSST